MMIDFAQDVRQRWIAGHRTRADKLAEAIRWLGVRYVLHPERRVAKLARPLQQFAEPRVLK